MLRLFLALAAAFALSGCQKISAAFVAPAERITRAFPLPDEVQLAMTRLTQASVDDSSAAQFVHAQFAQLQEVRALTCTSSKPVGRFDTAADIKAKVVDPGCFGEQDALIAEWIGIRRLAVALGKPPLLPFAPLGAQQTLPAMAEQTVDVIASSDSNVAVLRSTMGSFDAVRLPDGKRIHGFKAADALHTGLELSPNGRLLAVPTTDSRGIRFIEVETGSTIWETGKYTRVVTWLPALRSLVLTQTSAPQAPVLLDALNAKAQPYPASEKRPTWAATPPGGGNLRLIGGYNTAAMIDHARDAYGQVTVNQLQTWRLAKSVTSANPFLMQEGRKLIYVTMNNLAWLDLSTGAQGVWDMTALRGHGFAKLDEQQIFFAVGVGTHRSAGRVLDVAALTVAPIPDYQDDDGLILALTPRSGYMRRGSAAAIGGEVRAGTAEDLDRAIASAQLETQLAKLHQYSVAQVGAGMSGITPSASAPYGGATAAKPMLSDAPADAQVAIVGVYEASSGTHGTAAPRTAGAVRISVQPASTPLVLVLSSYEPVRWLVRNGGRKISAVLLAGHHESNAIGVEGVPVLRIGSSYAYKLDSPEYLKLKQDVGRYVANPVRSFQGSYSGQEFAVSGF